jgi:hypothetical protein
MRLMPGSARSFANSSPVLETGAQDEWRSAVALACEALGITPVKPTLRHLAETLGQHRDHSSSALLDLHTLSKKLKKCCARSVHDREQRLCASSAKGPRMCHLGAWVHGWQVWNMAWRNAYLHAD